MPAVCCLKACKRKISTINQPSPTVTNSKPTVTFKKSTRRRKNKHKSFCRDARFHRKKLEYGLVYRKGIVREKELKRDLFAFGHGDKKCSITEKVDSNFSLVTWPLTRDQRPTHAFKARIIFSIWFFFSENLRVRRVGACWPRQTDTYISPNTREQTMLGLILTRDLLNSSKVKGIKTLLWQIGAYLLKSMKTPRESHRNLKYECHLYAALIIQDGALFQDLWFPHDPLQDSKIVIAYWISINNYVLILIISAFCHALRR